MKTNACPGRAFFSGVPLLLGLLTCVLIVGVLASAGCSQSQSDQPAESGKPEGTVSPGATGTGTLADEKDQKLPINPEDYEPMPFPSVKPDASALEGETPQEPAVQDIKPDKTKK